MQSRTATHYYKKGKVRCPIVPTQRGLKHSQRELHIFAWDDHAQKLIWLITRICKGAVCPLEKDRSMARGDEKYHVKETV